MGRRHANLSVVLVVIGALLVPFATVALYARAHVIDPEVFADRAVEALDEPAVRRAVKGEIVGALLARTGPGVRPTARALLSPRVDEIIASAAFRRLFRAAALDTNRRFFEEGERHRDGRAGGGGPAGA